MRTPVLVFFSLITSTALAHDLSPRPIPTPTGSQNPPVSSSQAIIGRWTAEVGNGTATATVYWDFTPTQLTITLNCRRGGETAQIQLFSPIILTDTTFHIARTWEKDAGICKFKMPEGNYRYSIEGNHLLTMTDYGNEVAWDLTR